MVGSKRKKNQSTLSAWYASLYTRRVDLVGDYAGAELFLVEGDSLLLEAFSDPLLDFGENAFQLLHAVYSVEKLLRQLSSRGCNFHIAFFDDHRHLCIPGAVVEEKQKQKYLLARAAIVRHLQCNAGKTVTTIHSFSSIDHPSFLRYLYDAGCYFVLCHDGTGGQAVEPYQWMIHWLAQNGWNVALINGMECHDTKVCATVTISRH